MVIHVTTNIFFLFLYSVSFNCDQQGRHILNFNLVTRYSINRVNGRLIPIINSLDLSSNSYPNGSSPPILLFFFFLLIKRGVVQLSHLPPSLLFFFFPSDKKRSSPAQPSLRRFLLFLFFLLIKRGAAQLSHLSADFYYSSFFF
jgi:hypothetical protein